MAFTRPFTPGKALELLDPKFMKWPGCGFAPDLGFRAIEIESLQDDEYDLFLESPADYLLRRHLPRLHGSLSWLSRLPELGGTSWIDPWSSQNLSLLLTEPETPQFDTFYWPTFRKLIDVVGKGGGHILGPRSSTDEVRPENLKATIEFTKEYGRYQLRVATRPATDSVRG